MTPQPLVSCIMPTFNRGQLSAQAIRYFLRQDYPNRELIVIDDGTEPLPAIDAGGAEVRYVRLPSRKSVGEKRNIGCGAARGEVVIHWDDDDWQAAWRISYQARELIASGADVCGLDSLLYFNAALGEAWRYAYPPAAPAWISGNTLCYRRAYWESRRFRDLDVGEDAHFVWQSPPPRIARLGNPDFIVALMHPGNVSPKITGGQCWTSRPVVDAHVLVGEDLPFYAAMLKPSPARKEAAASRPQALVSVAKGIGDILRATPLIRVLSRLGYDVDVLIDPDYPETAGLLDGAPEVRRLLAATDARAVYDLSVSTYWGAQRAHSVQSRRRLTFDRDTWLRSGDTVAIQEMARAVGWNRELPPPFAMDSGRRFDLPEGTVALHPGCKPDWPWKKWHGFDELARMLPSVALIGTPADLDNRGSYFERPFDWPAHARNFIGALTLRDTAALLKQCAALVSNDSGMMHLAAALGIPTLGIFGITSPERETMPLPNLFPITKGLECEPECRKGPWGRRDCHRKLECLRTLSPTEVHQRLVSILGAGPRTPRARRAAPSPVKLLYHGHPFDATGYGAAARAYIHALHRAGVEVAVDDRSRCERQVRDKLVERLTGVSIDPDFHLFHGIPPQWAAEAFRYRNAIGMTVWETDTMPTQWRGALDHVLETWLPCGFNMEVFRPQLSSPVFKLPHPFARPAAVEGGAADGEWLEGIAPDDFVVYSIFEWQDRKCPEGQITAYLKAFPEGGSAVFVIKTSPTAEAAARWTLAALREETRSKARVQLRCERWSEEQIEALHRRGDCYLSLHRGEGWCYPLFDAVCRGNPAVATDHSGPLEYLDREAHALVRCAPTAVRQPYVYYHSGMKWADPDIGHAAEQLRRVFENRDRTRALASRAATGLRAAFSLEAIGEAARQRLLELRERTGRRVTRRSGATRSTFQPPTPIPGNWFDADYFETGAKSNWRYGYHWNAFQGLFTETAALLTEAFPNARSFLDAGCAKGFLVRALRERGVEAWGFDVSQWAIDHADSRARPFCRCADTDTVRYDRTFDFLVAMDLLTQLTEEQLSRFLRRARGWTRSGMFAIFSEQDPNAPGNRDFSHVMRRDRAWWHRQFVDAGWRPADARFAFERECEWHELPRRMRWRTMLYSPGDCESAAERMSRYDNRTERGDRCASES